MDGDQTIAAAAAQAGGWSAFIYRHAGAAASAAAHPIILACLCSERGSG